jgi:hypothetical protein
MKCGALPSGSTTLERTQKGLLQDIAATASPAMNDDGAFATTGYVIGGLTALITFVCVYIAAIGSVGWVFGIALGWIPDGLKRNEEYLRYLWIVDVATSTPRGIRRSSTSPRKRICLFWKPASDERSGEPRQDLAEVVA